MINNIIFEYHYIKISRWDIIMIYWHKILGLSIMNNLNLLSTSQIEIRLICGKIVIFCLIWTKKSLSCNLIIALSSFVHLYNFTYIRSLLPLIWYFFFFPHHLFNSWFNLVPTLPFYYQKISCIYFSIIMLVQLKASFDVCSALLRKRQTTLQWDLHAHFGWTW